MGGWAVATVKAWLAGVGSVFAAWSVAWTWKVWGPSPSGPVVCELPGPEQGPKGPPSTLHWKLEPASVDEKVKLGVSSSVVPVGPESIEVFGALESST
jgi:hypothetical protein